MYLIALLSLAIVASSGVNSYISYKEFTAREREVELLEIGTAYAKAIKSYYYASPGSSGHFPKSLDDLLEDKRSVKMQRHLRKRLLDPITSSNEWGLIMTRDGEIMGVYSLSNKKPFKTTGFPDAQRAFSEASSYQDWKFEFTGKKE